MPYEICTPFTGMHTPPIVANSFWNHLQRSLEVDEFPSPMFNNPQCRVILALQKLGMPATNEGCTWHIGHPPGCSEFFTRAVTYQGCEEMLAHSKLLVEDPISALTADNHEQLKDALDVASELGYRVGGPWSFLMFPQKGRKLGAYAEHAVAKYPDAWFILSYDDCTSDQRWRACVAALSKTPRKGVAWFATDDGRVRILPLEPANLPKIKAWAD